MLCHSPASQQVVCSQPHQTHSMHEAHATHAAHMASDSHSAAHQYSEGRGTSDASVETTCLACAAVCGASPLPVALGLSLPVLEPAHDWRGFTFLEPLNGVLARLERPPRSI